MIALILQAVLTVLFAVLVIDFNVLPTLYVIVAMAVLLGLLAMNFFFWKKKRTLRIIEIIVAVLISIILAVGSFFIIRANIVLDTITGDGYSIHIYKVIVMKDDPATSIKDAKDYTFGTIPDFEYDEYDEAIAQLNKKAGKTIETVSYPGLGNMLNALYSGEVDGLIYESSFGGMLDDINEEYYLDIKSIEEVSIKSANTVTQEITTAEVTTSAPETTAPATLETEAAEETTEEESTEKEEIHIDPFIVYLSGNDEYNEVSVTGRSDVNILAVVNFDTHQVLLVSVPRDYYLEFPGIGDGSKDKLTHAGIYGIDTSVNTLAALFETSVQYYARVNFTSVVNIIDAIGGLAFYNPYEFRTTYYDYYFAEGEVWCDGWQALQYMRERKSLEGGDLARGEHQQIVIKAMIDKLVSAASITHYNALMDAIESCAITNMSSDLLKLIVKKQLQEGGEWEILRAQADGYEDYQECYAAGGMELAVVIPYQESVDEIKVQIAQVLAGTYTENEEPAETASDGAEPAEETAVTISEELTDEEN